MEVSSHMVYHRSISYTCTIISYGPSEFLIVPRLVIVIVLGNEV